MPCLGNSLSASGLRVTWRILQSSLPAYFVCELLAMTFRAGEALALLRQTMADWNEDKVPRLGAALAFYTALSIAPLLVLSLRFAAMFFGVDAARNEIESQIAS